MFRAEVLACTTKTLFEPISVEHRVETVSFRGNLFLSFIGIGSVEFQNFCRRRNSFFLVKKKLKFKYNEILDDTKSAATVAKEAQVTASV